MSKSKRNQTISGWCNQTIIPQSCAADISWAGRSTFWSFEIMLKKYVWLVFLLTVTNTAYAQSRVQITGDFETGQIQPKGETHDGFFVKTLPDPQGSADEIVVANGGAGPNSGLDTRVVPSDLVGSERIRPRKGNYFARAAIYFDKDYTGFSGNSSKNKPRTNLNLNSHPFDYDTEGYIGFSIYVPLNFEDEVGKTGVNGKSVLLTVGAPSAETFYSLSVWTPSGERKAHWFVLLNVNADSVTEGNEVGLNTFYFDIGPVEPDKGKWTDFVIRFRSNPFSTNTNPAAIGIPNAKDQVFAGNKGILQVWKAEGPVDANGNREMILRLNKLNTPVGLVPHKSWQLDQSLRIYKHGWHLQPTSVQGPVWFGFDEIRFGLANRDGTGYSDVHPAGLACTDRCPPGSTTPVPNGAIPNPPELIGSQ